MWEKLREIRKEFKILKFWGKCGKIQKIKNGGNVGNS